MALGSLVLWIGIPVGWLFLTRGLEDAGTRFLITIVGCVLTMAGAGWLLYRLEAVYARTVGIPDRESGPPSWMRRNREAGAARAPMSLLELLLVASAVVAAMALVVWWALFADSPNPSGPLQPL